MISVRMIRRIMIIIIRDLGNPQTPQRTDECQLSNGRKDWHTDGQTSQTYGLSDLILWVLLHPKILRSSWPRRRRSSSQTWCHLRWALSRRPPTAARCLGCTTSLPGPTPPTAALLSPPSEIWTLLSFNVCTFCKFQVSQNYRLQNCRKALCSEIDADWNNVIQWILPKCLPQLKNLTKTSKQKLLPLSGH